MIFWILKNINLLKSLYYNLRWFPLQEAIHLPLIVGWNTQIRKSGHVIFEGEKKFGQYSFGIPVDLFRNPQDSSLFDFRGNVVFKGRCNFGKGCKVIIDTGSRLQVGNNFNCSGGGNFESHKELIFGNDCVLSWDITILDTDFHPIYKNGDVVNIDKSICIGDHVWIGHNCSILKGVNIADGVVVASGTLVASSINTPNCVVGNNVGIKIIREGITWSSHNI